MKKQVYITFMLTTLLISVCKSQNLKETTKSDYTLKTFTKKGRLNCLKKNGNLSNTRSINWYY